MKKTLIVLAVLGTGAGMVHAQSNVTIYGVLDTGYVKETGRDLRMGQNRDSRIGFKGVEDLGSGLKAIFQLENRFMVNEGIRDSKADKEWEGAANIGLASINWGTIRFGRVNELTTETIKKFDPFRQDGIGQMIKSTQRSARIDNTVRYDSPKWAGVSAGLSYSLGNDTESNWYNDTGIPLNTYPAGKDYSNDGYGINLSYDSGSWMATANWSRIADSNDSSTWNAGVAYKFNNVRVSLLYEKTKDEGFKAGGYSIYDGNGRYSNTRLGYPVASEQENWLLGLEWDIGSGQFDASVQRMSLDDIKKLNGEKVAGVDGDIMKYSVGYTYNLSKRTAIYGQVAYTDWDAKSTADFYGYDGESTTALQIGMTHRF